VTVEAGPGVNDRGHPETYIDMVHTPAEWTKSPAGSVTSCAQALYMTVDLGAFYEVGSVTVWNYYGDTRKYCGQKIALSATGSFAGEETVVYDTKQGYGPVETKSGNNHVFSPTVTRFVRYYSSRNVLNKGVHFLEMDIYGYKTPLPNPNYVNLEQLKGVKVLMGPGMSQKNPKSFIDMNPSPSSYPVSPTGSSKSCADPRYVTVDLGNFYEVQSAIIWNYYADGRRYCGQKIALSKTGVFAGEQTIVYDTKGAPGPVEVAQGNNHPFAPEVTRFVRYYSAGSNKNTGVHMVEIDIMGLPDPVPNPDYINLEQLKGVTVQAGPGVNDRGHPETYIDMVHTPAEWTKSPAGSVTSCAQALYMTVNLGAKYIVGSVTVWNYYGDTRKYCGQKIALSTTGSFAGEETVVYDTKSSFGPLERKAGNNHAFQPVATQYVRYYSSKSTRNNGVHFLELDIYGKKDPIGGGHAHFKPTFGQACSVCNDQQSFMRCASGMNVECCEGKGEICRGGKLSKCNDDCASEVASVEQTCRKFLTSQPTFKTMVDQAMSLCTIGHGGGH
jgi:hypothetical protein